MDLIYIDGAQYEAAGSDLELQANPLSGDRYAYLAGNPTSRIEYDGHYIDTGECNQCKITIAAKPSGNGTTASHYDPRTSKRFSSDDYGTGGGGLARIAGATVDYPRGGSPGFAAAQAADRENAQAAKRLDVTARHIVANYCHAVYEMCYPHPNAASDVASALAHDTDIADALPRVYSDDLGEGTSDLDYLFGAGGIVKAFAKRLITRVATRVGRGLTDGERVGIVREAFQRKGNYGLGRASRSEADELGLDFVGPGFARSKRDPGILISKDGLRQYRPPSFKPNMGRTQANSERRFEPGGRCNANGHLDIDP